MAEQSKISIVSKTFKVIKAFADIQPEWGVRDLAKTLDYPASTMHRFLMQLQEEGILEWNSVTNKYRIGVEMIRISSIISSNVDVKKIARPFLTKLAERHKESMFLILYHSKLRKVVFVDKVSGPDMLQYVVNLGEFLPVPYGASGKSTLAFLDRSEIEAIYEQEGISEEKRVSINHELAKIRELGYASTQSQRIPGAKGLAAPIFNSANQPIGSLIYTVPITRFDSSKESLIAGDLVEAVKQISSILGWGGSQT